MHRFLIRSAFFAPVLAFVTGAWGQSVVVNEFRNTGVAPGDTVELVVITDNLNMQGMIIKDFSGNGNNDGGRSFTFTSDALWSSVRAGTIIVLTNSAVATDVTVGGADYDLEVGLGNSTSFTGGAGTFDIGGSEIVMIKASGSGANIAGSIHAFGSGTGGTSTNFTPIATPKLRTSGGDAGTGESAIASNSTATLADFNGTDAAGDVTAGTIGTFNNANNQTYILSLRGAPVTNQPPTIAGAGAHTGTNGFQLTFNVIASDATDNDVIQLSASNLPSGAVFNTATNAGGVTNVFNWNPAGPVGVYTTVFYAVDNDGVTAVTSLITIVGTVTSVTNDPIVWINELHYDNTGGDVNEGYEIAGPAGTDLTGYYVLVYDGSGVIDISNNLTGVIDNEGCGFGALGIFAVAGIENGPEGLALCQGSTVIQFISYEGSFTPSVGPAAGIASLDIGVAEASGNDAVGLSLQLQGSGTNYNQFAWHGPTNTASMGSLNAGQTISPCGGANSPPIIQPIGNKVGTNNQAIVFDVVALDVADGDLIELSASNLPGGAVFNTVTNAGGVTNTFTWNPAGPPGVYVQTFFATDNDGVTTQTISITVLDPPSIVITNANETVPFATTSIDIGGTASTNVSGEFTWTNALNGATGTIPATTPWTITGIGLGVGANVITVRGSNQFSETTSASVTITRSPPAVNGACNSVIAFQGFEGADTWTIDAGAGNISTDPGATDNIANNRILSGTSSWQVNNGNATLQLASVSISGYTSRYVTVRISSTSTNATAAGADVGDNVRLTAALDGAAFGVHDIFLKGNNNARWGFWATNVLSTFAGSSISNGVPQAGLSTNHYSYFNVLLPDSATSVAFRVTAVNDESTEIWNVDDISLFGCSAVACTDCDNDGLDDAWEVAYFGNTTSATNAAGDVDGDGFSNLKEFFAKSNPNNFASKLQFEGMSNLTTTAFIMKWQSHTGATYVVTRTTNILAGFTGIQSNIPATPPLNVYTDVTSGSRGFYNVTVP